jgi:hypothetical protein
MESGVGGCSKGLAPNGSWMLHFDRNKANQQSIPKDHLGYQVILLKAASQRQGGVALLWGEGHWDFEVEAVTIVSPNLLTFQLVMGEDHFFAIGVYILPNDTTGVDDLPTVWAARPANCKPLLLGDLNVDFGAPQNMWEEIIADFLDDINVAEMSRNFFQQQGQQQGKGARWTWGQRRGGKWYQSQPDYIMAFQQPRIHNSDHCAVVAMLTRGRKGRLHKYH